MKACIAISFESARHSLLSLAEMAAMELTRAVQGVEFTPIGVWWVVQASRGEVRVEESDTQQCYLYQWEDADDGQIQPAVGASHEQAKPRPMSEAPRDGTVILVFVPAVPYGIPCFFAAKSSNPTWRIAPSMDRMQNEMIGWLPCPTYTGEAVK